jgi:dTDP-4-dehydrorhamnose reductase
MKIIITGGSGLLALNWAYFKRDEHDICLFTHTRQVSLPGVHALKVNLLDQSELRRSLAEFRPNLVVHTAGMTNVDACETAPRGAHLANVEIACNVAKATSDLGIGLVHISTDHLFSGSKPLVTEEERPTPLNVYGKTKLDAERCVSERHSGALIIRTNFYGWGHANRASFSDWIIDSLRNGESITVFDDVYYSPILIDELVSVVHDSIDQNVHGVLNIAADKRISKYEFSMKVAEQFKLDTSLINKGSIKDAALTAARPTDMSLSIEKVKKLLQRPIGDVMAGISALERQMVANRRFHLDKALGVCRN